MTFDTSRMLPPMGGNNLNTRASSLRVMNARRPTAQQLVELEHRFFLHTQALRTSLVGFLTRDGELPDGSRFRFVSNSGIHQVLIWPAGGVPSLVEELLLRVFCIPADTTHQFGWTTPAVPDTNGTTATSGTRRFTGAEFNLVRVNKKPPTKGTKLTRYNSTVNITTDNSAFFTAGNASNLSVQNWQHREWISADRKRVVTTYSGSISVNGSTTPIGLPGADALSLAQLLWAAILPHDPGDGEVDYVYAVGSTSFFVRVIRKPLAGSTWELVAELDVRTREAGATVETGTGGGTMRHWVKKVDANASGTAVSMWLQNPLADGSPSPTHWVGITDVALATGAMTHTAAEGEVTRYTRPAHGTTGAWDEVYSVTGNRQIAFEYEGDEKVYTRLRFTGEHRIARVMTESTGDAHLTRTTTDTREVWLERGNDASGYPLSMRIAWVETIENVLDQHASWTPGAPPNENNGIGTATYSDRADVIVHACELLHYGGRGDVFMLRQRDKRSYRFVTGSESGGNVSRAEPVACTFQLSTSVRLEDDVDVIVGPGAGGVLDIGDVVAQPGTESITGPTSNLGGEAGSAETGNTPTAIDTNPTNAAFWGSATNSTDSNLAFVFNSALSDTGVSAGPMVTMGTGHPRYTNISGANSNPHWFNGRVVDDFIIFSVPKVAADGNPDPTQFFTHCTHEAIKQKMNVHASLGVLKEIRLK